MSDTVDAANKLAQREASMGIERVKVEAAKFEQGNAGECSHCGDFFMRVVEREGELYCGACRDELRLG